MLLSPRLLRCFPSSVLISSPLRPREAGARVLKGSEPVAAGHAERDQEVKKVLKISS